MSAWSEGSFGGGAIPAMEQALRFASARHRLILENIANADTPGYRRKDLDAGAFQKALEEARRNPGEMRPLELRVLRDEKGSEEGGPDTSLRGMLRHDGNDVDIERELALMSRNAAQYNRMANLLKKAFDQIRMAIAERPTAT